MAKPLKFKRRKIDKNKTREVREKEATQQMADIYRQNPHRFISTELGCTTLTWFQDVIVYLAFRSSLFFYIATRGIGKSFIIGWIVVAMAILFPRIKIVLASSTKGQARLLVTQKIMGEIYNRYPNVRKEIVPPKSKLENASSLSFNDTFINFWNGSQIVCVTSSENSRGNRCAVLVLEESAKIDQDIKTNVLVKFLQNGERIPRYKDNPEYEGYRATEEKKKQIHITSAEFQTNPVYKECMDAYKNMQKTGSISQVLLSMHWGFPVAEPRINMTYEDDIKPEMEKSTFSQLWWTQENEGLFVSESEFSMFGYQELNKLREVDKVFLPVPDYKFNDEKDVEAWKKEYIPKKKPNELRVLSIDVALMGGKNDHTIFTLTRAIPSGKRYKRELVFMEHQSNAHSEAQSIRMKQLYRDFDADVICLDCMGNGMGVADAASKEQFDPTRGMEYEAFTVFNRDDMKDRAYNVDISKANACIYGIKQDAKFNNSLILYLKSAVESGRISLPLETNDARALYQENKLSEGILSQMIKTNIETDLLIKEMMALEVKQQQNSPYLKVDNPTMRKDRFSSFGFANFWIQEQEDELHNEEQEYDADDDIDWYFTG